MRRNKYSVRALLFAIALLVSLAVPVGAASSTSIYDDSYQGTESLRTGSTMSGQACDSADVTFNWASYLTDASKWYGSSDRSADRISFLLALASMSDGAWGVLQYSNGSLDIVEFWWTEARRLISVGLLTGLISLPRHLV